jgi:phosphopentomutase
MGASRVAKPSIKQTNKKFLKEKERNVIRIGKVKFIFQHTNLQL